MERAIERRNIYLNSEVNWIRRSTRAIEIAMKIIVNWWLSEALGDSLVDVDRGG